MKKVIAFLFLGVTIVAASAFTLLNANWNIDPNYAIKFSTKKAEGTISGLKGTIVFDPTNLQNALMNVEADASTIKTGSDTKDKHAKGESWLDVAKYPTIRFASTGFTKSVSGYQVTGTLEMHGVKQPVTIPFQFNSASAGGTFMGSFKISRKAFGVKGNFFGFAVGDELDVTLKVPVN